MAKYEVCGRCEGKGTVMNPSIGECAYTREDFDADPDFEEAYFSGAYDVKCPECDGLRVIDVETPKHPCEDCGVEMYSYSYEEIRGSGVYWEEFECHNRACESCV